MWWVVLAVYGWFAFVALTNFAIRRATPRHTVAWDPAILIPARNEAENLAELLPLLQGQGVRVYVYDDGSIDGTAEVAARHGATVLRGAEQLPERWVGKNYACHQLAKAALEDHSGDWMLFLDADTRPGPQFISSLGAVMAKSRKTALTGMPRLLPGAGIEPLYMSWVVWIIAATNPFGLVRLTGWGHNMFMNGQLIGMKKSTYFDLMPHEQLKGEVLEDVKMGRLLAKHDIGVEIVDVSGVFGTRMYRTFREALDGMSKNSADIAGSAIGTIGLAAFLVLAGWAWVAAGLWGYGLLMVSSLAINRAARQPLWVAPLLPIALVLGAFTCLRALAWKRQGRRLWKGRNYV